MEKIRHKSSAKMRYWWMVLFLLGIFLTQLFAAKIELNNILDDYHLRNYANADMDWVEVFGVILWSRGKIFLMLFLLSMTTLRSKLVKILPPLLMFVFGTYLGMCFVSQGLFGIGICLLSLFPHGAIYLILIYTVLHKKKPIQYSGKRYFFAELLSVFITICLFILGCLTEATVGNFLLKNYLLAFISAIS